MDNFGTQSDPAVTDPTSDATITALLKGILSLQAARAGAAANVHEPAAATAAVVTKAAAGVGVSNVLARVAWSYDASPTAGSLIIEDGIGTTIFKTDITSAGPGFQDFIPPLKGSSNTALVVTLASGAGAVSGIVSIHTWTQ